MSANILHFHDIDTYLQVANCDQQAKIEGFCILRFSELGKNTLWEMPPCQKNFYQITFVTHSEDTTYWFNTNLKKPSQNTLFFVSPTHVYAWRRDADLEGYLLFFNKEFLDVFRLEIRSELFELFDITLDNTLNIDEKSLSKILFFFELLHEVYNEKRTYTRSILRASLLTVLNILAALKAKQKTTNELISPVNRYYFQYLNLVNSLFLKEKSVHFYAKQLYISPNHLNTICKKQAGITAKMVIIQRILEEAKYLINFSDKSFSEITLHLGFKEVAHFSRFFKKQMGTAPQDYRKANH